MLYLSLKITAAILTLATQHSGQVLNTVSIAKCCDKSKKVYRKRTSLPYFKLN